MSKDIATLNESGSTVGNESYDDRFAVFLNQTNQKALTAKILENILLNLSSNTDILKRDGLFLLDVGCGEGTLAKQLIPAIRSVYKEGTINYTGLDYNAEFVKSFSSALSVFPNVNVAGMKSDAFSSEPFEQENIDISIASHMIYHSYNPSDKLGSVSKAEHFVENVIKTLAKDSIALMIHEARNSDMREIGTQFGSELMPNAPEIIQEICADKEIPVGMIPFEAELRFPKLNDSWWGLLKKTSTMPIARQIPEMNDVLHLLGFVAQRDFSEMEKEGLLEPFVTEVQKRLAKSDNHALTIRSQIQIALSNERSPNFEDSILECCAQVNDNIESLQKSERQLMLER